MRYQERQSGDIFIGTPTHWVSGLRADALSLNEEELKLAGATARPFDGRQQAGDVPATLAQGIYWLLDREETK